MKPLNCLIVDDSSVMRRMVRRTMELSEVPLGQVHEANNGREALGGNEPRTVNFSVADGTYQVSCGRELVQEL